LSVLHPAEIKPERWTLSYQQKLEFDAWDGVVRKDEELGEGAQGLTKRKRRKGAICGKSLKRGERCYNCK
jgi:hypothetical protein